MVDYANADLVFGIDSTQALTASNNLDKLDKAADRTGKTAQRFTGHIQNAGYQVGDFAVQVASGQNVMMALSQQLPQLLGGFGAIGAVAGAATAILGAAWMVMGAGDDASKRLKDSLSSLSDVMGQLDGAQSILKKSANDLFKEYGLGAGQVREAAQALLEFSAAEAKVQLAESLKIAREQFQGFAVDTTALAANIKQVQDSMSGLSSANAFAAAAAANRDLLRSVEQSDRKIKDLSVSLGVSEAAAKGLAGEFNTLVNAGTLDAAQASMGRIRDALEAAGVPLEKMPAEIRNALSQMASFNFEASKAESIVNQATGQTNAWAGAMSSVLSFTNAISRSLSAISGSGIQYASAQAEIDALKAGQSLQAASFAGKKKQILEEGKLRRAELQKENDLLGYGQSLIETGAKMAVLGKQEELASLQEIVREREAEAKKAGNSGSSKAAAELKTAEKNYQSLQELLQQDTIFQVAEYEKRYAQLVAAREKQLLTNQEYDLLESQLKTAYFGSEYEQQQLQYSLSLEQLRQAREAEYLTEAQYQERVKALQAGKRAQEIGQYASFFGNMATIAEAGGKKTFGVLKAFQIAEGLLNSYGAYLKVLNDPALAGQPWLRTALAYSTLGAGLAQVANIKSVSSGGSGGGGAASASSVSAAPQAQAQKQTVVRLNYDASLDTLVGPLIEKINEAGRDGHFIITR